MTDLRAAAELCEFCPKMCRFSCPVSEATSREALTPWGKVSLAALAQGEPGPSAAEAFAGCTGCLRCQVYCAHANDVPRVLYAARARSVQSGSAPLAFGDTAARFAAAGHGESADLLAVHRAISTQEMRSGRGSAGERGSGDDAGSGDERHSGEDRIHSQTTSRRDAPRAVLFAGCDALAQGGDLVRAALAVARSLGAPLLLGPETALCCGLKLVEAGHPEAFEAHAQRTRSAIGKGPVHLVFLDAGCARAVRERWPALPAGSTVEHITTHLARALASHPDLGERPPLPIAVAWHDPCELARGLTEVTAPRALLAAAVEEVREPVRSGTDTSCCGAAGLLPRTLPAVAASIASARRAELAQCGGAPVTSSPACASALAAEDLVVLLADWLGIPRSAWRTSS